MSITLYEISTSYMDGDKEILSKISHEELISSIREVFEKRDYGTLGFFISLNIFDINHIDVNLTKILCKALILDDYDIFNILFNNKIEYRGVVKNFFSASSFIKDKFRSIQKFIKFLPKEEKQDLLDICFIYKNFGIDNSLGIELINDGINPSIQVLFNFFTSNRILPYENVISLLDRSVLSKMSNLKLKLYEVVKYFIDHKIPFNYNYSFLRTCNDYDDKFIDITRDLLILGADVNYKDGEPLYLARKNKRENLIKLLQEYNVYEGIDANNLFKKINKHTRIEQINNILDMDPDIKNYPKILDLAIKTNNVEFFNLLIPFYDDYHIQKTILKLSLKHVKTFFFRHYINVLIGIGVDLSYYDSFILKFLVAKYLQKSINLEETIEIFDVLVKYGANPTLCSGELLLWSIKEKDISLIKFLITKLDFTKVNWINCNLLIDSMKNIPEYSIIKSLIPIHETFPNYERLFLKPHPKWVGDIPNRAFEDDYNIMIFDDINIRIQIDGHGGFRQNHRIRNNKENRCYNLGKHIGKAIIRGLELKYINIPSLHEYIRYFIKEPFEKSITLAIRDYNILCYYLNFLFGACITVVTQIRNETFFSHLGDSRIIVTDGDKIFYETQDHEPLNKNEKKRIKMCGGYVHSNRVNGNLAISRAMGDFSFSKIGNIFHYNGAVSSYPTTIKMDLIDNNIKIIQTSDSPFTLGRLCKIYNNKELIETMNCLEKNHKDRLAARLAEVVVEGGSNDDTIIMITPLYLHNSFFEYEINNHLKN